MLAASWIPAASAGLNNHSGVRRHERTAIGADMGGLAGGPESEMGLSSLVLSVRSTEDHRWCGPPADLGGGDRESPWLRPRRCGEFREPVVGESVDDKTSARPEHRSHAHEARLARCVDGSERDLVEEVLLLEDSNEPRLCMLRQITIRVLSIVGFHNDLAIDGKEGTEGVIPVATGFFGQFEDSTQQGVLIHSGKTSQRTTADPGHNAATGNTSV